MSVFAPSVGGLGWYARHEARLAWRDWLSMMTAGKPGRIRIVVGGIVFGAVVLHLIALGVVPGDAAFMKGEKSSLVLLTGSAFLAWTLMLSQAMESVTRGFYTRADMDLLLSSPASSSMIFALRMASIALATIVMAWLLVGPFINVLAYRGGLHFLAAYGVLAGMGALATALAIGLTVGLFRLLGPRRTRFIAQVVAAIIGAGFVIGVQAVAIISYGKISRFAAFEDSAWIAAAPGSESLVWIPARAAAGDGLALLWIAATGLGILGIMIGLNAGRFGSLVVAASSTAFTRSRTATTSAFRTRSIGATLRAKEWTLLARDPWLVSQTLMQVLYLIPPALLLWRNYGADVGSLVVLAPVLVMAAGQLAGGLAWLAISGEDAPDLVATAPITPGALLRAKVEAVLGAVLLPVTPIILAVALVSPGIAVAATLGVLAATGSATLVQIAFRRQASRSHFRRRQTSSRIATFAEAFVSLSWAAAAGFAAAGSWLALAPALFALAVLGLVRLLAGRNG